MSSNTISSPRLSGLSPFMGDSDAETFANITRAEFDFDDDAFDAISDDAKDFITSLLIHKKEWVHSTAAITTKCHVDLQSDSTFS